MKTLYVSDLDGTLLRENERTSEYTNRTINKLVEEGMLFSYATARSFHTSHKVTEGLNAKFPLIIYNGTMVVDNRDESFMLKNFFGQDVIPLLEDLFLHEVFPMVYAFIEGKERFSFLPSKWSRGIREFVETRKNDERIHFVKEEGEL